MKIRRALLLVKRTALTKIERASTRGSRHVRRLVESGDTTVAGIRAGHAEHIESLRQVRRALREAEIVYTERRTLPRSTAKGFDLVVAVGGDGMVLGASHSIRDNTPLLGVNSEPSFSVGYLTGCIATDFAATLAALRTDSVQPMAVHRLRLRIGRKILPEPVLNDVLFSTDNPALMCRYRLDWPGGEELQRSSGVWISTPAGSTSALASAGGPILPLPAAQFAFIVREPYSPPGVAVRYRSAVLVGDERLGIECRVEDASVYLDGSHQRYRVPFGETVWFRLHPRPLYLVRPPQ